MRRVYSLLLLLTVSSLVALRGGQALADNHDKISTNSFELRDFDDSLSVGLFAGALILSDRHELYDPRVATHQPLDTLSADIGLRLSVLPFQYLGAELEAALMLPGVQDGSRATLYAARAQVIGQLPIQNFTPFVLAGFGIMGIHSSANVLGSDVDPVAHAGAGVKYKFRPHWEARADLRLLIAAKGRAIDTVTTHGEVLFGLTYHLGSNQPDEPKDFDGDGIVGTADLCPHQAGPAPEGCPPKDPDGDGIVGDADACPLEAETVNNYEDQDGCPDTLPDTDKDGVLDINDACPTAPEDIDNFEDDDGCPDNDNDKDSVLDLDDSCPIESGPKENKGCPDTDRDEDTVVDRLDNCPDEKGTVEEHGCKKKQLVVITSGQISILEKVFFQTNKDIIRKRSYPVLDNVAEVMKNHPEIKVQIAGHTDDRGDDDFNLDLSKRRAESVARYLVGKGISLKRLDPKGFGETMPAMEGTNRKARDANRRVEFKIMPD